MTAPAVDIKRRVEESNGEAAARVVAADPMLVDVAPAGKVVEGIEDRMILHSGPPITWNRMCGAQRGSAIGLTLFEGWAESAEEAERLLASSAIRLEPNHHHHGVGPMAGTTSRSLPVWVVENRAYGNRAFCRLAENWQQFGDFSADALDGLRRWRDVWAPSIRTAVHRLGGVPLKPIIAKALHMGDELHNRPNAASSLFANAISAAMVEAGVPTSNLVSTLRYIAANEFLFLGVSMAAAKSALEPAEGIEASTMVTAMARNGTEFGIRVSGLGDEWFTAPAPRVDGLFLPGFNDADAGLDMGDSAITETVGWGGFVLGGAPGILSLVGGTPAQALAFSRQMREITIIASPDYRIPALDFAGAPVGIDVRKVVRTGIEPIIDTAIAHREPGHAIIGAGLVRAPMECFKKALLAYGARYGLR